MKFLSLLLIVGYAAADPQVKHCTGECQMGDPFAHMPEVMKFKQASWAECGDKCQPLTPSITGARVNCVNGMAGEYPCENVDMLSFTSLRDLGSAPGANGNDIWGWEDPLTGREYVITGQVDGSSFVDITDPVNPLVLGFMPSKLNRFVSWRDPKVYKDHVFVVADGAGHGLQVFDLARLRNLHVNYTGPVRFTEDVMYNEFGNCHNIAINEDTGFLYCGGSSTCNAGPHMVDIREPKNPKFVGCAAMDGYAHDIQVITYDGPDTRFTGKEILFGFNEDSLTIYDVTNKDQPIILSRTPYVGYAYTHQGWLTADRRNLLLNDEADEVRGNNDGFTQTYIWNVESLTRPVHISSFFSPVRSVDHNLYIKDNHSYQSNYESGLRILNIDNIYSGELKEVAYFDCRPGQDGLRFFGTWSNYPYFKSGVVAIQSIERGLFILQPNL